MALAEGKHASAFLVSEAPGKLSRENMVVASGQNLTACQAVSTTFVGTAPAAAHAGNTGDGVMGAITEGVRLKVGRYELVIIEPGTNVGNFLLFDPDGILVGQGDVASAFTNLHMAFTLADGATDFVAGDGFSITVVEGASTWKAFDQDLTTGEQFVDGILIDKVDATTAAKAGSVVVRDAEVNGAEITWPSDITAAEQVEAEAQLRRLGIHVR